MIKFYEEFPEYEKVATLSQQLTWSHFVELLPIQDELKREFYAAMCKNEIELLRDERKMSLEMFYHRSLRRLVLVELKLGEFEPQDKGQVDLFCEK